MLGNEIYTGVLLQGKRGTPNYKVHSVRQRDREEWIRAEGSHEPLVSNDEFLSVGTMLRRDRRAASGPDGNIFSGFLYCADCGHPMVSKVVPAKGRRYRYYVCSANKRREGCSPYSISKTEIETAITNAVKLQVSSVLDISNALEYIDSLPASRRAVFSLDSQIERLEGEIEKCRRMKLRIYEDFTDGIINKELFKNNLRFNVICDTLSI